MTLTKITDRPSVTVSQGTATLVGGPANVAAAWSDSSDATGVRIAGLCRNDNQVPRVGFPAVSIPAGARVYSVEIRRRVLATPPGQTPPVCLHWHRAAAAAVLLVLGAQPKDVKKLLQLPAPSTTATTPTYLEESLGEDATGPGGAAWDPDTNLSAWNASTNPGGYTYAAGRNDDGPATLEIVGVWRDIYYQTQATLTVTGPTGTNGDTRPTITWEYDSAESQPQRSYRVGVYTLAQTLAPGFVPFETIPLVASGVQAPTKADSWWLLGEDQQWTITADLTDGDYVAYVQLTSAWAGAGGDFTTEIETTSWTRDVVDAAVPDTTPPPPAVLTSVDYNATLRRTEITFEPGTPVTGADADTTAFSVQHSRYGGVDGTWEVAPSMEYIPANGTNPITVYDRLAPLNAESVYRVVAFSQAILVATTQPSNEITVTPTGHMHRLIHPTNPLLDVDLPLDMSQHDGIRVVERQMMATYQFIGGDSAEVLPKVSYGPTYGREYELESLYQGANLTELYPALRQLRRTVCGFLHPDGTAEWVAIGPGVPGKDTEETYTPVPGRPDKVGSRRRSYVATQVRAPAYY